MQMPWPLIASLLLGFGLFRGTGAAHGENAPPAQIVGTVLCAPCFNRGFSRRSNVISGASVLIECTDLGFRTEVTTDDHGKFEVRLPSLPSEDAKEMQGCTVKLIKSSNPACDAVSSQASLRLKLNRQLPQELSVGTLAFTPRHQPSSCGRKPTWRGPLRSGSEKGSIHAVSAQRASKLSNYPPTYPAMAPVTSPPVLESPTMQPSLPFPFPPSPRPLPFLLPPFPESGSPLPQPPPPYFPPYLLPPTAGATPPSPSIVLPFPPLTQPPIPSSPKPQPPLPYSPPYSFPPTAGATPPSPSIVLPFPPLTQPPIPSSPQAQPPLPYFPPYHFPPTAGATPPSPSSVYRFPPLTQPPIPSSPYLPTPFPFPLPPLPAFPPTLPFPLPPIQASAPPPPAPSR